MHNGQQKYRNLRSVYETSFTKNKNLNKTPHIFRSTAENDYTFSKINE